ncbi:apolipoprotein N-acyltransferase [uncultured Tateyamaria sp.]|uniref:apolipoprotein N-acyltransferase n=1 Tax=uncultured Tateyamaria sp. TaxID=455651 RepID=UPI002624AE4E|nr:apolipoprotein N-acyltransferase [uncultured Tateyamaria sp.]
MNPSQRLVAVGLIAMGGGMAAGGAVHSPEYWACGPLGLFCVALAYTHAKTPKTAAMVGAIGGFFYFAAALPFLLSGYASIGMTGLQPIAGVIGLYILLSMWWPIAFALAFKYGRGRSAPFLLTALWGLAEFLRSFVFPAIPIAQLASITSQIPVVHLTRLVTVELLSVLLILICVTAAFDISKRRWPLPSLTVALGAWVMGLWANTPVAPPQLPHIASINTAIPQAQRWDENVMPTYMSDLTNRTQAAFDDGAELVVWPEVSVPFFHNELAEELQGARPPKGAYLGIGIMTPIEEEPGRFWNSFLILDSDLNEVARYDKRQLFPFGEYIPFAEQLERFLGLSTIATTPNAIAHGTGTPQIRLPGLDGTIITQICYEGSYAVSRADRNIEGAYIINISNDAWWEGSSGARFVEQEARLRAIEAGLPLVRVPNMHRSATFDARGNLM